VKLDLLRIVVPTPIFETKKGALRERYASANAVSDHGRFGGRKSEEYLALFRAVREAARAEMIATAWATWEHDCEVLVVRYHRTLVASDATNLGKVECDALEPSTPLEDRRDGSAPFPGIFLNDRQVRPYSSDTEYDPEGPDRVLITVRRRYPNAIALAAVQPKRRRKADAPTPDASPDLPPGFSPMGIHREQADPRLPSLNGKRISFEEAARLMGSGKSGSFLDDRIHSRPPTQGRKRR